MSPKRPNVIMLLESHNCERQVRCPRISRTLPVDIFTRLSRMSKDDLDRDLDFIFYCVSALVISAEPNLLQGRLVNGCNLSTLTAGEPREISIRERGE